MLYEILIRRKNLVYVPADEIEEPRKNSLQMALSIVKNIEVRYGVTLDFINTLSCLSSEGLKSFYALLIEALDNLYPTSIYNPFYVNFPQQVIDMDEVEMYTNSVIHYTGDLVGKRILIKHDKKDRAPLLEELPDYKILSVTTNINIIEEIFNDIASSKTSISKQDKSDLKFIIKYGCVELPEKFNHKEVMAFTIGETIKHQKPIDRFLQRTHDEAFLSDFSKYFKTPTDLLRLAASLSDGDISLSEKTKFKSFNRKTRRFFLSTLNEMGINLTVKEDLNRHRTQWLRLTEKLHPGEYKNKYPNAFYYADMIRNKKIITFNSIVEKLIDDRSNDSHLMEMLRTRPGDFARRIINLIDKSDDSTGIMIVNNFELIVNRVTTITLLNILSLTKFLPDSEYRSFLNKQGNFFVKENNRKINVFVLSKLNTVIQSELLERFSKLEPLGNVYLDHELNRFALPLSQRSASSSVETITRYSRLPIDKDNLRFFLYWDNIEGDRVDLDLSVSFFDENWNLISYVSYTHLKDENLEVYHSGDFTSGPAAEHIDCDLNHLESKGVRYVVPTVHNFTKQSLENVPEASFGWMERERLEDGEIYELLTVKNRIRLVSGKAFSLPCIIDTNKREMIWCDLDLNSIQYSTAFFYPREMVSGRYGINPQGNNVENNMNTIKAIGIGMTEVKKPTIYDLLLFHVVARGESVENVEEADVVFSVDNKTHLKLSELMNNYLI